MQHILSGGKLLDANGVLCEAGYSTSLVKEYDRAAIKAGRLRIKEWDYYLIYNQSFGIALTIDDNSYMGLLSASFLDFGIPAEKTKSLMSFMPMGKTGMPRTSAAGDVCLKVKDAELQFLNDSGTRRLICSFPDFDGGKPLEADLTLTDEPEDSMVIATPFKEKKTAFYYNQKIVGMRAEGSVTYKGKKYIMDDSFGLLDWGRGVWTYDNTWYWGAAQGRVDEKAFGFNIGYGFGDTSAAGENMIFYEGRAHKLEGVEFKIPEGVNGPDFMSPWEFVSTDGRFEMSFQPIIDRKALTSALVIMSDQHQVFGKFSGRAVLDGGTAVEIKDFLGFAEVVRNKW